VNIKEINEDFSYLLLPLTEKDIKQRLINKGKKIDTGFTVEREKLLLPPGAITILAAPTSHGKTTLLINFALNIAKIYPEKSMYLFSYEEDIDMIFIKALSIYIGNSISTNNLDTLRNYFIEGNENSINQKCITNKDTFFEEFINNKRLSIHYVNYDSDTLIEAIRYLSKEANPGAIFIDYIQLLNLSKDKYKFYSRQEELKQICISLKNVAVETGLSIILASQFNRTVTNHLELESIRLGEAGDLERIANLIVAFWNNDFPSSSLKEAGDPGTIYCSILKNREGKVGLKESLKYQSNTDKISNF